jgi:preprotein translocase subunit SecG
MGFVDSSLTVFMLAALFIAIAFILSWFIKEIPLRQKSAAQEAAEAAAAGH